MANKLLPWWSDDEETQKEHSVKGTVAAANLVASDARSIVQSYKMSADVLVGRQHGVR
jgi:hypothetical protein